MTILTDGELITALVVVSALVVGAILAWKVGSGKEYRELAEARGNKVEDLQNEIDELKNRLSYLEGQVEAMTRLKAEQIADYVVKKLGEAS